MGAKAVIVILVLVGVAFFVMLGFGARRNDSAAPPPRDKESRTQFVRQHPPPAWIGSLLGGFSARLTLPQKTIAFGPVSLAVEVPPSDKRFRQANFAITEGCRSEADCGNIAIQYESHHPDAEQLGLQSQTWQPGTRSPREGSMLIFRDRGPITFQCLGVPRCEAVLQ